MSEPVSSIRNLGPAFQSACDAAGIKSAEALRTLGADAAYQRLLEHGHRAHFVGYYALVMGLQGRPWNDCRGAEKQALRQRFDALCAAAEQGPKKGRSGLEAALDAIGVINKATACQPTNSSPAKK